MAEEEQSGFSDISYSTPSDTVGLTPVLSDYWSSESSPTNQQDSQVISSRSPTPFEPCMVSLPRPDLKETAKSVEGTPGSPASSRTPLYTREYLTPSHESRGSCRTPVFENYSPISDDWDLVSASPDDVSQMSVSPASDLCLPAAHLRETNSPTPPIPEWGKNLSPSIQNFCDSDSSISTPSLDSLSSPEQSPTTASQDQFPFSSTCKWAPYQSGVPLRLEDICILHVLFRVEEFPVESLALLPRSIRRRVINGLSHADFLHLGTALYGDLNIMDPFRKDYDQRGHVVAREKLLEVVLAGGDLHTFLSLNLEPGVLDCFYYYKPKYHLIYNKFTFFEHIKHSHTSLKSCLIQRSLQTGIIFPQRLLQFLNISHYCGYRPHLAWPLLHYCNMYCAPKQLKIDCYAFRKTIFWKMYKKVYSKKLSRQKRCTTVAMDPVIPFIQEFLSGVEVFELGTHYAKRGLKGMTEAVTIIPYVLLYNIVTSSQPQLKHLRVYGLPMLTVKLLEAISELLSNTKTKLGSDVVRLASSKPEPYQLEHLSIVTVELKYRGQRFEYTTGSCAHRLASVTQSIVDFQMRTLRNVTIRDLGFCYSDEALFSGAKGVDFGERNVNMAPYTNLLSSLNELLKQSQFEYLCIDKSPFQAACELILTFLTAATTHEQTLSLESKEKQENKPIVLDEEADNVESDDDDSEIETEMQSIITNRSRKRRDVTKKLVCTSEPKRAHTMNKSPNPIFPSSERLDMIQTSLYQIPPEKEIPSTPLSYPSQSFPETNAQYKCLDLRLSSSGLHSWLFRLPELRLKKLTIRTQDMTLVPADMVIHVEHVAFTSQVEFSAFSSYTTPQIPTIESSHLEKFVISNTILKRLEFTTPVSMFTPGLLPALNHCLSVLYQQGRRLDEIILNSVEFEDVGHMREFFIRVRDLSHSCGTTLTISSSYYHLVADSSQEEITSLFEDLSKQFQVKKIRKIIFTACDNNETDSLLELLTEELVFYRKFSFCTENSGTVNNSVQVL